MAEPLRELVDARLLPALLEPLVVLDWLAPVDAVLKVLEPVLLVVTGAVSLPVEDVPTPDDEKSTWPLMSN